MEDDHVDRPGVEERQRLKLTGTNSSIGLIVLIPYAHRGAIRRIVAGNTMIWPALTHERPLRAYAPRGRRKTGDAQSRLRSLKASKRKSRKAQSKPASHSCVSPTWWLWRSGCTRSHSELGRETLQRQWYFVSRRGRVGRCQVCKAHKQSHLLKAPIQNRNQ